MAKQQTDELADFSFTSNPPYYSLGGVVTCTPHYCTATFAQP